MAAIGGIHRGITLLFGVFGGAVNNYSYITTLIGGCLKGLGDNPNFLNTQNYSFKKKIWYNWFCGLCCLKKILMGRDSSQQYENFQSCNDIIEDRLSIENYIQDSMELQIIKSVLLKQRHKTLIPLVRFNLANQKRLIDRRPTLQDPAEANPP
jgi:hypothetical protein